MLDIQDRGYSGDVIRKSLTPLLGKKIKFRYNLGRNKHEVFEGKIVKIYNSVFLIEVNGILKSFSFADIVTKIIKIYC